MGQCSSEETEGGQVGGRSGQEVFMVCESIDGGKECEREEKAVSGFVKVYEQDCESSKA